MDGNSTRMTKVWAMDLPGILYRRTNRHSSSTKKCRHDCVRSDFLPITETCIICISYAVRHLDTETHNFFASNAGLPNMMTGTFIIRINGTQAALVLKISVFYDRVVSDRNSSRFTSSLYIIVRLRLTFDWSQCWPKLTKADYGE